MLTGNIKQGLSDLVDLHPFWGAIVLQMQVKQKDSVGTFAVDGKNIFYNKAFADSFSRGLNMFAFAHEAGHVMFNHFDRIHTPRPGHVKIYGFRGSKPMYYEPRLYNIAGDHVINLMLKDCGFEIWKDCCCDPKFRGMKTEQVYNLLEKEMQQTGKQPKGDGMTGDADILPSAEGFSPDEIKDIVQRAAAIARSQGKLPASLEDMIKEATEPQYPVYHVLERFIDSAIRDEDYSFHIPNRRYVPYGIVMPSLWSEKVSDVTLVYDTSGSVSDDQLNQFHRVAGDIVRKLQPAITRLIESDAGVHAAKEFKHLSEWKPEIQITGRGGTDFRPAFTWLAERRITPSCLVYLTDLAGTFPEHAPSYPVVWVSVGRRERNAPFGMTLHLQ